MATVPQPYGDSDSSDMSCYGACMSFLHNTNNGTYCGKSCMNWFIIIVFYVLFVVSAFAVLYLAVYIMMCHIQSISSPWLEDTENVMGSPGLGFRPLIMEDQKSPLVWYTWESGSKRNYKLYTSEITKFLEGYSLSHKDRVCENLSAPKRRTMSCFFNSSLLGPCGIPNYGYDKNTPCIYLKLNKLYGWSPDCYNDVDSIPSNMPEQLKQAINDQSKNNPKEMDQVWVSCNGVYPTDDQHMGDIKFYPLAGFQSGYFPYLMQDGYRTPLVAIQFLRLDRNVVITLKCTAWAKNLVVSNVEIQIYVGRNPDVDDAQNATNVTNSR